MNTTRGCRIHPHEPPRKTYAKGRLCLRCESTVLSVYNPEEVCGACHEKMLGFDAASQYDAHGLPMSYSVLEVHLLLVLLACPLRPVRLYGTVHENGVRVSKSRITHAKAALTKKGWVLEHHGGKGTALVAWP